MKYYARIKKCGDREYLVDFPELSGCLTEEKSIKQAKENAKEALNGWLAASCDHELNIPDPVTRKSRNYYAIPVDLPLAFAIYLRKFRMKRSISQAEVAKKLGITQQAYAKLESPEKANLSLKTIQKLLEAFEVEFDFVLG